MKPQFVFFINLFVLLNCKCQDQNQAFVTFRPKQINFCVGKTEHFWYSENGASKNKNYCNFFLQTGFSLLKIGPVFTNVNIGYVAKNYNNNVTIINNPLIEYSKFFNNTILAGVEFELHAKQLVSKKIVFRPFIGLYFSNTYTSLIVKDPIYNPDNSITYNRIKTQVNSKKHHLCQLGININRNIGKGFSLGLCTFISKEFELLPIFRSYKNVSILGSTNFSFLPETPLLTINIGISISKKFGNTS